jgi:hypothetical protein
MQAKRYLHGAVSLSTEHKAKPRAHPVWVLRYRLPSGKDSRRTLGKAWLKASRPPANFMTKAATATSPRPSAICTTRRIPTPLPSSLACGRATTGRAMS